jgi:hypothetical protein
MFPRSSFEDLGPVASVSMVQMPKDDSLSREQPNTE